MKASDAHYFNFGPRLNLAFTALIALIVGGNGLVIWQFHTARTETDRLTGANQQLIAVLRLQGSLLLFHQRLDDLARSRDADRLTKEAEPLRRIFREQAQQTRTAVANFPPETRVDPALLPTLEAIEGTLLAQLDAINELAKSGDWGTVQRRLDNELKPIETQTSVLVDGIDRLASSELTQAAAKMGSVLASILVIVPATAISTVCIAALLGWSVARRMLDLRVEERVNERTRIARDFHDTLLQSFQGVVLKFSALRYLIPERPDVQEKLDAVVAQARQAVTEGRDAVLGLRSSTVITNDLARSISALGEQLAADQTGENTPLFHVAVEGTSQDLVPIVRDEINRIAGEALRNAFHHARARQIEVAIHYDKRRLRLRVHDDGKGIDPRVLEEGRRTGHYGIPGMHERAELVGGKLAVWSEPDSGTEIELTISAAIAYAKSPVARQSKSSGQGAR